MLRLPRLRWPRRAPSPAAAPFAVVSVDARVVVMPVCRAAHWRHAASSAWNCPRVFPLPGSTMTLGPVGSVAHAVENSAAVIDRRHNFPGKASPVPS